MTALGDHLQGVTRDQRGWHSHVPSDWMQGRTAYGGFSAALAHHCVRELLGGAAPPLRSAQIAFVGPLAGEVAISCELLRQGRNTAFVEARIASAEGLGFQANLIFMNPRLSKIAHHGIARPDIGPPPADEDTRSGPPEFFTHNFDYPEKRLTMDGASNMLMNWHRISVCDHLDPMTELLCIGDGLPPSAMGLMTENGPISSMNWQVNILDETPATDNGWWLLKSETHHAGNGASSQYMTVWNSRLEPVMAAMQSVALFV